jgi:hypothetical protein
LAGRPVWIAQPTSMTQSEGGVPASAGQLPSGKAGLRGPRREACARSRNSAAVPSERGVPRMQRQLIGPLSVIYRAGEREAAGIVADACLQSIQLITETWGLKVPADCRVYVMTSWREFMFDSAPWHWRLLMAITLPLWFSRVRSLWRFAGGWTQRYGTRLAVGVKPPRLMSSADKSIGERIFVHEDDVTEKVRHVTCHELTHAFVAHLRLPSWLNEGLAMVTVDRFFGKATVHRDTLALLGRPARPGRPREAARLNVADKGAIVHHYVRGYWIARYLAETNMELLRELLSARTTHRQLESRIAAGLGVTSGALWTEVDSILLSHFEPPPQLRSA